MIFGYQRFDSTATVKSFADMVAPLGTQGAMLQAETNNIRYTLDGATVPTPTVGMLLIAGLCPEQFTNEELRNIKFCASIGGDGKLHVQYSGVRSI